MKIDIEEVLLMMLALSPVLIMMLAVLLDARLLPKKKVKNVDRATDGAGSHRPAVDRSHCDSLRFFKGEEEVSHDQDQTA